MSAIVSYWATDDDKYFEVGHYVEQWELTRISQLSDGIVNLLAQEALGGNKIRSICKGYVHLCQPLAARILNLPAGLAFCCPLQEASYRHYEGDEDGVIICQQTGTRVSPTGYESDNINE